MSLKYFEYAHLPDSLQEVSKQFSQLAKSMDEKLPDCRQKQIGMDFLLLAKDAFVRANLEDK